MTLIILENQKHIEYSFYIERAKIMHLAASSPAEVIL